MLLSSATIKLTRLAPFDLWIRISLMHPRSAWAKTRYPYRRILSNQPIKKKNCNTTLTQWAMLRVFFATNTMSALAFCSKCIDSNHKSKPMTHVHKSSLSDRQIFMSHMLRNASPAHGPSRSLGDCPVSDKLIRNNILDLCVCECAYLCVCVCMFVCVCVCVWFETM